MHSKNKRNKQSNNSINKLIEKIIIMNDDDNYNDDDDSDDDCEYGDDSVSTNSNEEEEEREEEIGNDNKQTKSFVKVNKKSHERKTAQKNGKKDNIRVKKKQFIFHYLIDTRIITNFCF